MKDEFNKLIKEDVTLRENCNLCKESALEVGKKTDYGAVIILRIGSLADEGWIATLSPKTGGYPKKDFTIQLMPFAHITHLSQINSYPKLAKNYGIAFSRLSFAISRIMASENKNFKATSNSIGNAVSVATYGKCTTWKEKKEHLHIKIFPFRGVIGQPYTVDSSFGRKEIHKDADGKEFVKMKPVKKTMIDDGRLNQLARDLIGLLKE